MSSVGKPPKAEVEVVWRPAAADTAALRRLLDVLFEDRPGHADGGPGELRQGRRDSHCPPTPGPKGEGDAG